MADFEEDLPKFTFNNMVVITSNEPISMYSFRRYLMDNWKDIMKDNTRLLILCGFHGNRDGKFLGTDEGLVEDTKGQLEYLEEHKKQDMDARNITIKYEPIKDIHLDEENKEPKLDEIIRLIMKNEPTILLLASCYTSFSIINDALKSQGVYSVLIMQKERDRITEGRCIFLDSEQKRAIFEIAERRPQLVTFQGNFGTGKTILLMEALRIKIEQYKQNKEQLQVHQIASKKP